MGRDIQKIQKGKLRGQIQQIFAAGVPFEEYYMGFENSGDFSFIVE